MKHSELRERRQAIAEYAKDHTIDETVAKFGVSNLYVYKACREFSIPMSTKKVEKDLKIAEYANEHGIAAACSHFNLSYTTVYRACISQPTKNSDDKSSHRGRKQRREEIAKYAESHTVSETAIKFGVSDACVYASCREFSVAPTKPFRTDSVDNAFKALVLLLEGHNQSEVARMIGFTKAYVSLIKIKAAESGLLGLCSRKD